MRIVITNVTSRVGHRREPVPVGDRAGGPRSATHGPSLGCRTLQKVAVIVVLMTSVMLAGCGTSGGAKVPAKPMAVATTASTRPASASAQRSLVMIIRHGEKPDGSHPGVDAGGNRDDSSLSAIGWNRAYTLVNLFAPAQGPPRVGFARPTAIYAASANANGEGRRTRETVQPLADALGIPVNTAFGKGEESALVQDVIDRPGVTLICWQHGEIPAIAEAFPAVSPPPPSTWPDDRFDVVWTLTSTDNGWQFAQLPEHALPQDQAGIIQD